MRVVIILIGIFILANLALVLLPTEAEMNNVKYTSKPLINESDIRLVNELSDNELPANELSSSDGVGEVEESKPVLADNPVLSGVEESDAVEEPTHEELEALKAFKVAKEEAKQASEQKKQRPAKAPTKAPTKSICYRVGPFLRESNMLNAGERLKSEIGLTYDVIMRESINVAATRVFIGPFPNSSEAKKARNELTRKGVLDHFSKKEQGSYIVSLGIYSNESSAKDQMSKFRSQDIYAKTKTKLTNIPENYWLEVKKDFFSGRMGLLKSFSWGESSVSLSKRRCSKG